MGRLILAAILPLFLLAASPTSEEAGRAIYERGSGHDALSATMGDPPQAIAAGIAACATCHGASGMGASEGGVSAPPLAYASPDRGELIDWLAGALRDGRGRNGHILSSAMPRYAISDRDLGDLAAYIRRLPYAHEPGLTADSIAIGLHLADGGFGPAEQGLLRDRAAQALSTVNAGGGIFGRKLTLAEPDAQSFFTISWRPLAQGPNLPILPPLPGTPDCVGCCGSLHAEIDAQVNWLAQWLEQRKHAAAFGGSLAAGVMHPASASVPTAHVQIGPPAEIPDPPAGALYLFADLGPIPTALRDRAGTFLVSSFHLSERAKQVNDLMRSDPRFISPGVASASIEIEQALDILLRTLRAKGRRVAQRDMCDGVSKMAVGSYSFTILDVNSGLLVTN